MRRSATASVAGKPGEPSTRSVRNWDGQRLRRRPQYLGADDIHRGKDLWTYKTRDGVANFLWGWLEALRWQRLPEMERLGDTLLNDIDGIAAYCDHPVCFGVVESLNTTIKAVLRRARGMRDDAMLLLKLKWATAHPIRSARDLARFLSPQGLYSNPRISAVLQRASHPRRTGRPPAGAKAGHGRRSGESLGVSVTVALSWPVSHAEGRVTALAAQRAHSSDRRIRHSQDGRAGSRSRR